MQKEENKTSTLFSINSIWFIWIWLADLIHSANFIDDLFFSFSKGSGMWTEQTYLHYEILSLHRLESDQNLNPKNLMVAAYLLLVIRYRYNRY